MTDLPLVLKILALSFLGFAAAYFCGLKILPILRRLQLGQQVRDDGPQSHLKKNGTPTFGGFIFLLPLFVFWLILIWQVSGVWRTNLVFLGLLTWAMAGIGFADDYIKVRINKAGLSVPQKTVLMVAVLGLTVLFVLFAHGDPLLYFPWEPYYVAVAGWWKFPYGIFVFLYLYFCINAVNLTDGVDGLATSLIVQTCLTFPLLVVAGGMFFGIDRGIFGYLFVLVGALLGFYQYNRNPARVFMGDTGSLALGAVVSMVPLLLGVPWLFAFFGLIYIIEALSVVIQVFYFKATKGKRIFKMSPIHHHFELSDWSERKIVRNFGLFQFLVSLIGLLFVYLTFGRAYFS